MEKLSLLDDIFSLNKSLVKSEFKLKRTLVDKDIVTNLLKQNLEELQKKNEIIKDQIAFKEQILANVNHELRTPLNAIIGMSDLLEKTPLNLQQKKYTDVMRRSSDNLFIIINDFLTVSSMNAGKLQLKHQPFTFHEICQDLYKIFSIQTDSKNLKLVFESCDFVNDTYLGDPTRIYQIFQNLLNNAIKFTKKGSVKFTCKVEKTHGQTKIIKFCIEDTGVGIPEEKQATIFNSFTQAFTANEKGYSGTGLGLNIVQHLVHLMDGTITMESKLNIGTKFTVKIPFKCIQKNIAKKENIVKQDIIPEEWKDYQILMIEDNIANIFYAKELLKRWNINTKFAETYQEGLEMAKSNNYDLILCDLNLPDGNGIDLIREIRTDKKAKSCNSKIAIITASILQSHKDKAAELDIINYIEKPFTSSTLLREFHKIFDNNESYINQSDWSNLEQTEVEIVNKLNSIAMNPEVQLDFANLFLKTLKNDLGTLSNAVKESKHDTIFNIAHKLKSSVKIVLPDLFSHLSLLEKYGQNNECIDLIKGEYKLLSEQSKIKISILEKLTKKLKATTH